MREVQPAPNPPQCHPYLREIFEDSNANICKEVLLREISKKNKISYISFCKNRARPTPEFNYGYKMCKHNVQVFFLNEATRGCAKCMKEQALAKAQSSQG